MKCDPTVRTSGAEQQPLFGKRILRYLALALSALLLLTSVLCATVLFQRILHPDSPPSLFGTTLAIMANDSMAGTHENSIPFGSFLFIRKVEPQALREGDVVAFANGDMLLIGRVTQVYHQADALCNVKADNLSTAYGMITEEQLIGVVKHHYDALGSLAIFLTTPLGIFFFCAFPSLIVLAIIAYELIVYIKQRKGANNHGNHDDSQHK